MFTSSRAPSDAPLNAVLFDHGLSRNNSSAQEYRGETINLTQACGKQVFVFNHKQLSEVVPFVVEMLHNPVG